MLMKVAEFERLFRQAAGLDVDKNDLKRVSDFLRDKLYDLLAVAERNAKYNGRDLIFEPDRPGAQARAGRLGGLAAFGPRGRRGRTEPPSRARRGPGGGLRPGAQGAGPRPQEPPDGAP